MNVKQGATIAAAVAVMFGAMGCSGNDDAQTTGKTSSEVKCQGVNECKGKSECASKDGNECQGLNDCKGHGWTTMPDAKACTDKGGKVIS